jgi:predicted RNA binding protein YcfA (HicA-like mRNA interferase family)
MQSVRLWRTEGKQYGVRVKVRDVIRMVEQDGWHRVVTQGDRRQYKHPSKPGRVTISGHPGDDMPKGTLASIRRQARLARGQKS